MTSKLSISAGQGNDKGIKPHNEDACGIYLPEEPLLTTKGIAMVIADGVSSSETARKASESCVTGFLKDYFSSPESWTVKTAGQRVLGALNRWLHAQTQKVARTNGGMLTTLSALIIKSTTAHLFHIGDTRIYRLRDRQLECLTQDHQVWWTSHRAFLGRAMGASVNLEIDYRKLPVEIDDIYVLTSDGVYEFINSRELTDLLSRHDDPERAARAIMTRALENGSDDNVTCQVLRIKRLPGQDEEEFHHHLSELPFPPSLDNGMVLDGYRIVREVHASERTRIYVAINSDTDEKVIIKTPSNSFDGDPEYIECFLHEEWVGRRINNPHVLRVLEPLQRKSFLYYVTEYIEGQTLRQWMTDHPRPTLAEVRNIVNQLVTGIRAFHRLEMVHQDLKPENIIIDDNGTVKIKGFGSTKIAGIREISTPQEQHHPLGSLNHAAPEHYLGHSSSNRFDIYALGVIAYEMLTGVLPYGKALTARNLKHVHYHHAYQFNDEIPVWLDGTLAKAVHLHPEQRYNLLSEFNYDLSHPHKSFVKNMTEPLIERNPVAFWRGLAIALLILNVLLIYILSATNI